MGLDEQSRHDLHMRLVEIIGEEAASTLMSSLPPDHWDSLASKADLAEFRQATKADIAELREVLDIRLESLKFELLAALHQEVGGALTAQTRVTVFTMAGSIVGLAGLAMAMARFA